MWFRFCPLGVLLFANSFDRCFFLFAFYLHKSSVLSMDGHWDCVCLFTALSWLWLLVICKVDSKVRNACCCLCDWFKYISNIVFVRATVIKIEGRCRLCYFLYIFQINKYIRLKSSTFSYLFFSPQIAIHILIGSTFRFQRRLTEQSVKQGFGSTANWFYSFENVITSLEQKTLFTRATQ